MEKLFVKYCPIFYFHKKEPYMPANFDEILRISDLNAQTVTSDAVTDIIIPKEKRTNVPIATQIICKTSGEFVVKGITYIDLIYIITFTWNGTLEEHAFDKEEVIVRIIKLPDNITSLLRVFGSAHGNGMWFNRDRLDFEGDKIIMYSANESHAMYNKARTYKRIFGFGNDVTGKDKKWEPSQFVIIDNDPTQTVKIYNKDESIVEGNFEYFKINKNIGNEKNKQEWPGSINYDTINLDGYYKFQGGIDNLFTGPKLQVKPFVRIILRVVVTLAWAGFLGYMIFRDVLNYKDHIYSKKELALFITLHTLLVLGLFLTGTILGLDIFVLNPINSQ